jgi:hypothetical protein
MKMTAEHFAILESAMNASLDGGVMLDVPNDMSNMHFRWTWLWRTTIGGRRAEDWVNKFLYPYLNDDHIDTALRRVAGHSSSV